LINLPRSAIYYKKPINESDHIFTNLIFEIWLEMPSNGYRKITEELQRQGYDINHKRVLRLMRESKIQAMYPRPNTSLRNEKHAIYPYLLSGLVISRPNQVWATDITYIKTKNGWMYLVAIIDSYSRYVIAWRLSNTMDASFCLGMLEEALILGKPEILNTDQGAQYTCDAWIKMVQNNGIRVSMDGKGRWADNIIIERFWRTLKHENILLHIFDTVADLKQSIDMFIYKYNHRRLHQNLGYKTPAEIYKGIHQAPNLVLGKKKEKQEVVDSSLALFASGGGLLSSPFLGEITCQSSIFDSIQLG
jgi:putative transposase